MTELAGEFPDAVIGLSDHSLSIHPCLGAVALGASILERHFTSDKTWPGPDIEVSMDPAELREMVVGSRAIHAARGGNKRILDEEMPTIRFAYASVVALEAIGSGDELTQDNIWVKRPGTGEILAKNYNEILGRRAVRPIDKDAQIQWSDLA
jgi:N-acetylneuraminate synthase